eukprot:TRINITY_DN5350_c0_g2_i3.p1 TRINITY_DN5350_c0_g2~~TRINITY_DN5350_c0_g2_i3.p1  ORF type:complete len:424 (+),score=71.86 TRINITY_DN5350_c0_g2_i3:81-1352(+)
MDRSAELDGAIQALVLNSSLGECQLCVETMISLLRSILNGQKKCIEKGSDLYAWKVGSVKGAQEVLLTVGFVNEGDLLVWPLSPQLLSPPINQLEGANLKLNNRIQTIRRKPVLGPKKLSRAFYNFQGSCRFAVGFSELQNERATMEDEIVILGMGPRVHEKEDYFAIFDGHGGQEGSNYAARFLHQNLDKNLRRGLETPEALVEAFKQTNEVMCGTYAMESGTCALVIFIQGNVVYAANLGDSRAVMGCRQGKTIRLTQDHKPGDPEEVKRIEGLGGTVSMRGVPRLFGKISVSRALGDTKYSRYLGTDPVITQTNLTDDTLFIILACDGIWDEVTDAEAVGITFNSENPQQAANEISNLATERKSLDNISVVVLYLKNRSEWGDKDADSVEGHPNNCTASTCHPNRTGTLDGGNSSTNPDK